MISLSHFTKACVELINSEGIDEVSVSSICSLAGISRPTFYSKLENIEGLLAETWLEYSEEFFATLSAGHIEPGENFLALSKILAVSHRVQDVSAVSSLSVLNWWNSLESSEKAAVNAWKIANRLGYAISRPAIEFPKAFSVVDEALVAIASQPLVQAETETLIIDLVAPQPLGEIHEATVRAIGEWGYKGASMARIARTLRVTSGAIYPSHSKIAQLLEDAYGEYQAQIATLNIATWAQYPLSPANYGSFIRGGLNPARKAWRQLRLETLLSAPSRDALRERAQSSLDAMADSMRPVVIENGADSDNADSLAYLFHTLGVGFGLLHDLGLPLHDVNHELASASLAAVLLSPSQP